MSGCLLKGRESEAEQFLHRPGMVSEARNHTGSALNEAFTFPDAQGTVRANKVIGGDHQEEMLKLQGVGGE